MKLIFKIKMVLFIFALTCSSVNAQSNDCKEISKSIDGIDIVLAILREDTCQIRTFLKDTSNYAYKIPETQDNLLEFCVRNKKNKSALFLVSNYPCFRSQTKELNLLYHSISFANCFFVEEFIASTNRDYFIEYCDFLARTIELKNLNYWYSMDDGLLPLSQGDTSTYCLIDIFLGATRGKMDSLKYGGCEMLIGARANLLLVKKLAYHISPDQKDSKGKTIFDYLLYDMKGQSLGRFPIGEHNQRVFIEYIDVLEFLLSLKKTPINFKSEVGDIVINCINSNNKMLLKKISLCKNIKYIINSIEIKTNARDAAKSAELVQIIDEIFD